MIENSAIHSLSLSAPYFRELIYTHILRGASAKRSICVHLYTEEPKPTSEKPSNRRRSRRLEFVRPAVQYTLLYSLYTRVQQQRLSEKEDISREISVIPEDRPTPAKFARLSATRVSRADI